ncbi:MAG: DUF748 domain-containing protein [Zoogloeaceae bacterium]|nr:DUF748 domain-containing protein [Zoogloeaceae bacterium]
MNRQHSRLLVIGLILSALFVGALLGARYFATQELKKSIERALGTRSEVKEIVVGFQQIEIVGIRIRGEEGWPEENELSAGRIVVKPDWGALLSRSIRIASIRIEDGYLSVLREKNGKLKLLPALLDTPAGKTAPVAEEKDEAAGKQSKTQEVAAADPPPEVRIGKIELLNGAIDFHDASIRKPPHKMRLEQTMLSIEHMLIPALTGETKIVLESTVKGVHHDGRLTVNGWMEIASKNSMLNTRLTRVDLVSFEPYLIKAAETRVRKGSLDMELKSTIKKNRLHAPGSITLSGLELAKGKTFMGLPRNAVLKSMKDSKGQIKMAFTLEGDVNDPKFSLNEAFVAQLGIGAASALGISLESLATGIGKAGGGTTKALGNAVSDLLGGRK